MKQEPGSPKTFCPYSGAIGNDDDFTHPKDSEAALKIVEHAAMQDIQNAFSDMLKAAVAEVFELREFFEWRGLGSIDHSGVRMREEFKEFDAERKFTVPDIKIADTKACQCGEVLKGVIKPFDCKVFGKACTPETPLGALMVSSEGACAAYYQYGDPARLRELEKA
ncbi:[NiFe] hydrogenase metallocenter assembly protein HypD [hydrothermal vent metagenome]|uniref:[NiFe] hydrogenase metallocenter assembly protein HypD n=1 Tax=hydrothermal vent metagenome TaxID=652676 RepID=A0A3B0SPK5_9ZZZZ